jgi:hypothetical protein
MRTCTENKFLDGKQIMLTLNKNYLIVITAFRVITIFFQGNTFGWHDETHLSVAQTAGCCSLDICFYIILIHMGSTGHEVQSISEEEVL